MLVLSQLRHLPKKIYHNCHKISNQIQIDEAAYHVNSIRKKVLKEMMYDIKDYLHDNLAFLIEKNEDSFKLYQTQMTLKQKQTQKLG